MSDIIFRYTRAEAIDDGVLVDLSEIATEAGFKYPVAITQGVNAVLNNLEVVGQDFQGRAWDMFTIFKLEIKKQTGDTTYFAPLFARANKKDKNKFIVEPVEMYAKVHAGDNPKPVITIMILGED